MLKALVEAMRPWQWTKNLLLFAPFAFAPQRQVESLRWALLAFCSFCCAASALYVWNDVVDAEADRQHERKRLRPVASGRISPAQARVVSLALLVLGVTLAAFVPIQGTGLSFLAWLCVYCVQTTLYSHWLKRRVIIDCLIIALGFVVRVLAGGASTGIECSSWILLCTFFMALFLACCKRREEVARHGEERGATRHSLKDYDLPFLDQLIAPLAALSILSYALYTVAPETVAKHHGRNLQITVPFVVFGVFRYLFLVHRRGEGSDPARLLLRDRQLLLSGVLWAGSVVVALRCRPLL
jgi:4-hydroxybenzoate polyprenyltransferase